MIFGIGAQIPINTQATARHISCLGCGDNGSGCKTCFSWTSNNYERMNWTPIPAPIPDSRIANEATPAPVAPAPKVQDVLLPCPFCGLKPDIEILGGFQCVRHINDDCPLAPIHGWSICVWQDRKSPAPPRIALCPKCAHLEDGFCNAGTPCVGGSAFAAKPRDPQDKGVVRTSCEGCDYEKGQHLNPCNSCCDDSGIRTQYTPAPQPAPSLEKYLRETIRKNIIDFAVRANRTEDDRIVFYIHPSDCSGETADFEVFGNVLEHNKDIKEIK